MARLEIDQLKAREFGARRLIALCPFHALEETEEGAIALNAACRMCGLCVKNGNGAALLVEDQAPEADDEAWRGIAVFAQVVCGKLHPVALELLGEARRLADKSGQQVYSLVIGDGLEDAVARLRFAGADEIHVYEGPAFRDFLVERYAAAFADFIGSVRPDSVLAGSTNLGRVLAPRVAARLKTGLTADCTMLDMRENGRLIQIRPAFGGNVMAQIVTKSARPQFCTVRFKIFSALEQAYPPARVVYRDISALELEARAESVAVRPRGVADDLSQADAVVAVGRGVLRADMPLVEAFARRLGASLGCTRPLVEEKRFDARRQIGLSGRTVRPRLIIALGVSGSVQFAAGMQGSERIVAINTDENAPIFGIAHVSVVGDYRRVLPELLRRMEERV